MGFNESFARVSAAADGGWMTAAEPLMRIPVEAAQTAIWQQSKRWIPAVSAFLTSVNEMIPEASVSEVTVHCFFTPTTVTFNTENAAEHRQVIRCGAVCITELLTQRRTAAPVLATGSRSKCGGGDNVSD